MHMLQICMYLYTYICVFIQNSKAAVKIWHIYIDVVRSTHEHMALANSWRKLRPARQAGRQVTKISCGLSIPHCPCYPRLSLCDTIFGFVQWKINFYFFDGNYKNLVSYLFIYFLFCREFFFLDFRHKKNLIFGWAEIAVNCCCKLYFAWKYICTYYISRLVEETTDAAHVARRKWLIRRIRNMATAVSSRSSSRRCVYVMPQLVCI